MRSPVEVKVFLRINFYNFDLLMLFVVVLLLDNLMELRQVWVLFISCWSSLIFIVKHEFISIFFLFLFNHSILIFTISKVLVLGCLKNLSWRPNLSCFKWDFINLLSLILVLLKSGLLSIAISIVNPKNRSSESLNSLNCIQNLWVIQFRFINNVISLVMYSLNWDIWIKNLSLPLWWWN